MRTLTQNVLASVVAVFLVMFAVYNYMPLAWLDSVSVTKINTLGAALTTIQGTDTLSASRTTINNNFSALNTSKAEISDVSGTTSLPSLAEVGTITSGTWNASTLTVPYGGTGSTSLSQYSVLLGSSTNAIDMVQGLGSLGQVLTSNGNGTRPTWQSGGVNETLDYNWTGHHTFTSLFATLASSTHATTTTSWGFGLLNYRPAPSHNASSSVLTNDGAGGLKWIKRDIFNTFLATSTSADINDTEVATLYGAFATTTASDFLGLTGFTKIKLYISSYSDSGSGNSAVITIRYNGVQVCEYSAAAAPSQPQSGLVEIIISNNLSKSLQKCFGTSNFHNSTSNANALGAVTVSDNESSGTYDTANTIGVSVYARWNNQGAGDSELLTITGATLEFSPSYE